MKTIKHSLVLALSMLLVAVMLMFISLAHAASPGVHDPTGDAKTPAGDPVAPYLDIVYAKVTEQKGTLAFKMELAGSIPKKPSEPDLIWPFHLDTNPLTFFGDDPNNNYADYVVRVRWFNGAFVGQVINRTTGVATPVPFSIDEGTVKVFVDPAKFGIPSSFRYNASTRLGPLPTGPYVDFAPDGGTVNDLATWPQ